MSGGSMIPPDIRSQLEAQQADRNKPHRGIGGGAKENAAESTARARAMGDALPTPDEEKSDAKVEEKSTPVLTKCPNDKCRTDLLDEWNFCAKCGRDLVMTKEPTKFLGIEPFTEADVEDYLFKGFIVRELPMLGTHRLRVKTSQPKDMKDVDGFFTAGEYKDKPIGSELYRNLFGMATAAACVFAIDGQEIGKDLKDRMKWLEEKGAAFVDMAIQRVVIFNRAFTTFLEAKNTLSGY